MAWLQDDGEENELSQFEEEEGEGDGSVEEIEEVIVTERPGAMIAPMPPVTSKGAAKKKPAAKPKSRAKARPKSKPKSKQKKRPAAKSKKKPAKKAAKRRGRR